jgi:hypothetical protein
LFFAFSCKIMFDKNLLDARILLGKVAAGTSARLGKG